MSTPVVRPILNAPLVFPSRFSAFLLLFTVQAVAQSNAPGHPALDLTLGKAIEMATSPDGDTSLQQAREMEDVAAARITEARSSLLPTLDGTVAEQNQTVNPRAIGLRFDSQLFTIPRDVGPYSTFDARVRLNQNVLNLSSIKRWQAEQKSAQAARSETETVRQKIAAAVARLYAAALWADAQVEVSKTNIADAEALRDLASHRSAVGEGTDLEVARANLALARDRQKMLASETDRTRTQLDLIKTLGIDWDTTLHLAGNFENLHGAATPTLAESLAVALQSRADFKMEESRIESARLSDAAARLERMPSIVVYADYGALEGIQTHTVGAELRISLFDGGRVKSDRQKAMALMQQEKLRQKELRIQVELQVRQALAALASAEQQVQVSDQAIALADEELGRARRRYEVGVTNSLEVIDAKTQLEITRYDRVAALYSCASARIDLAQAMGTISQLVF